MCALVSFARPFAYLSRVRFFEIIPLVDTSETEEKMDCVFHPLLSFFFLVVAAI